MILEGHLVMRKAAYFTIRFESRDQISVSDNTHARTPVFLFSFVMH